jgi:hypothetical protein
MSHERIVRAMAQQNRLVRRKCGVDLHYVLSRNEPKGVFARIHMSGSPPSQAFVFLAAKRQQDMTYEQYREARMQFLITYCNAIKGDVSTLKEAIGVAAEPFSDGESSFEFLYVDHSIPSTEEERKEWRAMADELGILRSETPVALHTGTEKEFPMPFSSGRPPSPFPSRAERRRAEREARKAEKKRAR